ncbi:MAG: hypothetical protein M1821_001462 [Bathelium mastoideum]|nr:MAG: hypothetical protein M1821_001462 [Bathelium mastoideum]
MRTRSKPSEKGLQEATVSGSTLAAPDENPGKLCILPKELSQEARIVALCDPASHVAVRYLYCPDNGFYEFIKVSSSGSSPKSWLVIDNRTAAGDANRTQETTHQQLEGSASNQNDYVTASADLLIATPYDALFFLLPALHEKSKMPEDKLYLSLDDYVDELDGNSKTLRMALQSSTVKAALEKRLHAVCDVVDAGEERMFRLSQQKLLQELLSKAQKMSEGGLPTSMEHQFVQQPLESPIFNINREENTATDISEGKTTGKAQNIAGEGDSVQHVNIAMNEEVQRLLRIRVALRFIIKSCVPPALQTQLQTLIASNKYLDFGRLDEHLGKLESIRSEALALRSMSENISRKRSLDNDDEAVEARAEKKRKQAEEERLKKSESRSVKQLKKVDTSGMKKLSSFFTKSAPKKASSE